MNLRGTTYRTVRSQNTKGLERTTLIEIKLYLILYLEKGYVATAFFMCNRRSWMFFFSPTRHRTSIRPSRNRSLISTSVLPHHRTLGRLAKILLGSDPMGRSLDPPTSCSRGVHFAPSLASQLLHGGVEPTSTPLLSEWLRHCRDSPFSRQLQAMIRAVQR